jgi:hypothetical protein
MRFTGVRILLLLWLTGVACTACSAEGKGPCEVITKSEAEAVVGGKLEGPQLSPRGTLCKYFETGYGTDPSKKKLVTIGLFPSDHPSPEGVNMRRQAILQDQSLLPVVSKELPDIGDAAIWVWAGGYFGALYTFKAGTLEVAVKISGISEQAALTAAKKFATRALGGTGKTGYVYAAPATMITDRNYDAPGILSPLYLGTLSQIGDDEMTRNYVISLVQAFNGSCPSVPEALAIMDYGFYYEWHANKASLKAGFANDLNKQFQQATEVLNRAHPHMLVEGHEDAATFLKLHRERDVCLTAPVQHLYNNIAELALERGNVPPDVDDDAHYLDMLSPAARENYKDGFNLPNHPSRSEQQQLAKVKHACLDFTKGAAFPAEMEGFCRCQVDAAKQAHLGKNDLDALGAHFNQQTLTELSKRNSAYETRKKACYH